MATPLPYGNRTSAAGKAANAAVVPPPVPAVRAAPVLPTVDLSTRTYSGAPPSTAVMQSNVTGGVNLTNRFSVTPDAAQTSARAAITAEQQRRAGNASIEKQRDDELSRLNQEKAKLEASTGKIQDYTYTTQSNPDGSTKIVKVSGYDPTTGNYKTSEDVAGKTFASAQQRGGAFGVSSGPLATISSSGAKIAELKSAIEGAQKAPGEDDYTFNARVSKMQADLAAAQTENQSATTAAQQKQAKEESLTPDLLAQIDAASKSTTGRISATHGMDAVTAAPPNIQKIFEEHPEMAQAYEPLVEALARDDKTQAAALFGVLSRLDKQGDKAAKVAEDAIQAAKDYHSQLATQSEASYNTQLDIAAENKAQDDFDKANYEHQQAFVISQKVDEAADNEMKSRRAAAAMGFTSDTNGLASMQKEARKAQDVISFLKDETNTTSAEMSRRATSTYSLSVKDLGQKYDATLLSLDHSLSTSLGEIQNTLNLGDESRANAFETAYQGYLDKVSKNDIETSRIYGDIVGKLNDQAFEIKKINMQSADADKKMQWQDQQATKKMIWQAGEDDKRLALQEKGMNTRAQAAINAETARQRQQTMVSERQDRDDIRTQARNAMTLPDIKSYMELASARDRMSEVLKNAIGSKDPNVIGAAKQLALTLVAKASDPTTGVKEGELEKFGKNQTWMQSVLAVGNGIAGGDMTGVSMDAVNAYVEAIDLMSQSQKERAQADMLPAINSITSFNNRAQYLPINPSDVISPEFMGEAASAFQSYYSNPVSTQYNYDYNKASGNGSGSSGNIQQDPEVQDALQGAMLSTGVTMDQIMGDFQGLQILSSPQAQKVINASPTESTGDIFSSMGSITQRYDSPISAPEYSASTVKGWGGKHLGIDVAMPEGSFVPSMTGGTIASVEYNKKGWGLSVTVKAEDGTTHRYSHLMAIDPSIKVGQQIAKGQEFGEVGNTGNTYSTTGGDGAHLDYRIQKNGKYIDPYSYYS